MLATAITPAASANLGEAIDLALTRSRTAIKPRSKIKIRYYVTDLMRCLRTQGIVGHVSELQLVGRLQPIVFPAEIIWRLKGIVNHFFLFPVITLTPRRDCRRAAGAMEVPQSVGPPGAGRAATAHAGQARRREAPLEHFASRARPRLAKAGLLRADHASRGRSAASPRRAGRNKSAPRRRRRA
jgi:hypothetical protein